jgi:hypothetical protein
MGYCEDSREIIGNAPLLVVRPSVVVTNNGDILLNKLS